MQTIFKKIDQLIKDGNDCPLPISVIPNNMGINLCSVDGIGWQKQEDGQLVSLTIYFIPEIETLPKQATVLTAVSTASPHALDGMKEIKERALFKRLFGSR